MYNDDYAVGMLGIVDVLFVGQQQGYPEPGGHGYGSKSWGHPSKSHSQVPEGFYPRFPVPAPDYDEPFDGPSFRNGAPVNGMRLPGSSGGIYGHGRPGGMERGGFEYNRGGIYGSYGAEGMFK